MEEKLKAMSTSLPLVGDLAHPAMRDRHWEQLMRATGKTFVKDDKFSLGDLLALGLHNYVDDCSEIVDRAQKVCISSLLVFVPWPAGPSAAALPLCTLLSDLHVGFL